MSNMMEIKTDKTFKGATMIFMIMFNNVVAGLSDVCRPWCLSK